MEAWSWVTLGGERPSLHQDDIHQALHPTRAPNGYVHFSSQVSLRGDEREDLAQGLHARSPHHVFYPWGFPQHLLAEDTAAPSRKYPSSPTSMRMSLLSQLQTLTPLNCLSYCNIFPKEIGLFIL